MANIKFYRMCIIKMVRIINKIKIFLIELLWPIHCLNCGQEGAVLCSNCQEYIKKRQHLTCPHCGKLSIYGAVCLSCRHKINIDGLIFYTDYQQVLNKKLIGFWKYKYVKAAGELIVDLLIKDLESFVKDNKFLPFVDQREILVIPVPIHKNKYLERGFNQSEIIAQAIGKKFNWRAATSIIERAKNTDSQTKLNKDGRKQNIKDAFIVKDVSALKNKNIVLIDDVYTSGATINELAETIKKYNNGKIWAIVFAKQNFS